MLCFMKYKCIDWALNDEDGEIYNLTAIGNNLSSLDLINLGEYILLNPYENISYDDFILNDNTRFATMFNIINKLYNGKNIYLLIGDTDIYDESIEMVQRFIFGRYGYRSQIINDIEDFTYINDNANFNILGLTNFDIDLTRYLSILKTFFS